MHVLYLLHRLGLIDSIRHIYTTYHILFLNLLHLYPHPRLYLHLSISAFAIYISASVIYISISTSFLYHIEYVCEYNGF